MRGLERSSRARHLLGVRCSAPDSHLRSSSAWTQERVGLRKPALPRPGCTRPRGSLQCSRLAGRCATGASRPRAACGAGVRPLTLVLRHARCPLHFAPLLGAPQGTPDSCDPASCLAFEASFLFEVLGQDRERSVGSGASSALRTRRDHVEPSLLGCPPHSPRKSPPRNPPGQGAPLAWAGAPTSTSPLRPICRSKKPSIVVYRFTRFLTS